MAIQPRTASSDRDALVSVSQAAALLGVHANTIRAWTDAGRLTAWRINRRGDRRYRRSDVERLLSTDAGPMPSTAEIPTSPEFDALSQVTVGTVGIGSVNAVCRVAIESLRSLGDVPRAAIYLLRDGVPVLEAHDGYPSAPRPALPLDTAADPVGSVRLSLRGATDELGILVIEVDDGGATTTRRMPFLEALAGTVGAALHHARLLSRARRELTRARALRSVTQELTGQLELEEVLDDIVDRTQSLFEGDKVGLWMLTDAQHPFQLVASREIGDSFQAAVRSMTLETPSLGASAVRERLRVDIGEGSFTGWVAEHAEPILSNDALHDGRGHTIEGTDEIEESMLVVPMVYEGRAVGVIALSKLGVDQFSADDMQTMTIFAGYAAQALVNARSYRRLEEQSAQLARQLESQRTLLSVNEQVMGTLEQSDIFEVIADGLRAVVRYDNLSIYRTDHVQRTLVPVLTRERHAEEVARYIIPFGRGLMGWAVDNGEAVLANDALNDPRALQIPGTPPDPEALVVVPLISDGRVTGSMNVSRIGGEEVYFSETEFEMVKLFAAQASVALRNADAHHIVSVQAETDALTGLGNHGAFQRDLEASLGSPPDSDSEPRVTLLMMDLDQFKRYNDRLGHPAGDALLHAVGTAISAALRSRDPVYRYGGDEFAVILPGATAAEGRRVADRIRRGVARLTAGGDGPVVTISIGVATCPGDASDKDTLISAADRALYRGKQSGEDQVVLAASRGPRSAAASGPIPALLALTRALDAHERDGQTGRVARLAGRIADTMDQTDLDAATVELVAHLRHLDPELLSGLAASGELGSVATAVGWLHRTRARLPGPVAGQVVLAALAYDNALIEAGPRGDRAAVLVAARHKVGSRCDAMVAAALSEVVAERPTTSGRRRRHDTRTPGAGAA